ncbi:MAG: response regulator [Desulfobacteraceae bacterium]|nr:response regulator [Desulfobacteraceae bacterium]MBC2755713.1 response regulator [Desulfobacteraceae bacterium]
MNSVFQFDLFFPYGFFSALSSLVCFFLAALTIQAGRIHRENQLFTILCLFQAVLNLEGALLAICISKDVALSISRFIHLFYVFIIPVFVQFIHEITGIKHRKSLVKWLYIFSLALSPLTQTNYYYYSVQERFFGLFPQGGPAFQIFGGIGLFATIYIGYILWATLKQSTDPAQKLKARLILFGIGANAALTVGNILPVLGIEIYPPGNFSFIPMGLMAYGLLRHHLFETTKSRITKDFIPRILTVFVWSPLIFSIIFWITAPSGVFYPYLYDRIFPYALPPILSFLACFIFATFCFMQRTLKLTTILFGFICTLWGFLNLDITLNMLVMDKHLALQISRINHFFLVNQLGLSVHFFYAMIGRKQRWTFVYPCYVIGLVLVPFTLTDWYFKGTYEYFWGFFAQKNILFDFFGFVSFIAIIWGIILLYRTIRIETDIDLKKTYIYVLIGVFITGIFNLCNIPAINGIELYPLGNFTFIPILIMGYGIFRHNILTINIYTRRRIFDKIVSIILILGYTALIAISYWALSNDQGISVQFLRPWNVPWNVIGPSNIFNKIYPYGIPPLISFICAVYISILTIRVGKRQTEAHLFSLLCLLMAFISLDILLNGIISDANIGIQVSRLDHLFLVFSPALCLHLVFLVIGRRNKWWIVYGAYAIALIMMAMTQTEYYIQSMVHYYWGFYPKAGVLFDIFALFFLIAVIYGAVLLIKVYRQTDNLFQKHRLFYLACGFAAIGALYVGDAFILMGYEIYPPGNFIFIPLLLWAYAFFKQYIDDMLQITRMVFFYIGLLFAALIIAVIFKKSCPTDWPTEIYFLGIILSILILRVIYFVWNNILALFFGEQSLKLEQTLEYLINNLSKARTSFSIFEISKQTLFKELSSSRCAMLIPTGLSDLDQIDEQKAGVAFSGWDSWIPKMRLFPERNQIPAQDAFIDLAAAHPVLPMFSNHRSLSAREQIEEWMMEHDIFLDSKDPLFRAEYILPVYYEGNLSCLLFLGNKIDGADYSRDEKEFFHRFGLSLGPYLENARLLQGIEKKVEERTVELQSALAETETKKEEITKLNQVVQAINASLDLDVIMSTIKTALKMIFEFNQIGIFLVDHQTNALYLTYSSGKNITEEIIQAKKNLNFPLEKGLSLNSETVLKNKPIYLPNITPEMMNNMTPIDQQVMVINPMKAMLLCPLEVQKTLIGTIVFSHTDKTFNLTESDINKIQRYVSQVATAVNNARLYDDLNITRKEAESANRAKSEFLANMSHEIRTPLNVVVGSAELLKGMELTDEQQGIVNMFQTNSKILLNIINDILDISRIESGNIKLEQIEFNLKTLVGKVCELFESHAQEKELELSHNIDPDLPEMVMGDPGRLQQVLMNLVDNALKFTPRGHVTVGWRYALDNPSVLVFSVADTGIGIAEDKQESVFENFSQEDTSTTRKFGGTGLGLTISKKLVELMGGRIWVKSKPGHGSTFYFTVPFGVGSHRKAKIETVLEKTEFPAQKDTAIPKFFSPRRILLVEDYEHNRMIVLQFLKETPFIIDIAENGFEAIEKFKPGIYDLILMDLQMPVMDGYDATREIRKIEKTLGLDRTPVIAVSAYALNNEQEKSFDAGCDAHLNKPVKKIELFEVIARYLPSAKVDTALSDSIIIDDVRYKGKSSESHAVLVDPMFKKIIPQYLEDLKKDVYSMTAAFKKDDYELIRLKAHNIKGSGGGFGFDEISRIGKLIEDAAKSKDNRQAKKHIKALSKYMDCLQVAYRK